MVEDPADGIPVPWVDLRRCAVGGGRCWVRFAAVWRRGESEFGSACSGQLVVRVDPGVGVVILGAGHGGRIDPREAREVGLGEAGCFSRLAQ